MPFEYIEVRSRSAYIGLGKRTRAYEQACFEAKHLTSLARIRSLKLHFNIPIRDTKNCGPGLNLAIQCANVDCRTYEQLQWIHVPTFDAEGRVDYGYSEFLEEPRKRFDLAELNFEIKALRSCPTCGAYINSPWKIKKIGFLDCAFKIREVVGTSKFISEYAYTRDLWQMSLSQDERTTSFAVVIKPMA